MSKQRLNELIGSYKTLLIEDGIISKEEIIEMLRLEPDIPDYQNELDMIADKILKVTKVKKESITEKKLKERIKLYNEGLSDVEIAEKQKVNPTSIWHWRRKRGLVANKAYEDVRKARFKLYNQGLTDKEIAIQLNETPSAIGAWRVREGLEPNKKTKRNRIINEPTIDRRLKMLREGMKYKDIAEAEGVSTRAIQAWCCRNNLTKDNLRL